jgi:hypothetical protein
LSGLLDAARVYAGQFVDPEPTFRLHRGDPMQKREATPPAGIAFFGAPLRVEASAPEAERRRALATWICDPRQPLPARTMANRLWQQHFGVGICPTPSDLGINGGRPSHPELLDWLAKELIEGEWKLKRLHRLMVTSATYRQAGAADAAKKAIDAGNRFLWRRSPRRLEAEPLRDAMLAVSGALNLRAGGPGFELFEPNDNYVKVYAPKKSFGPEEFRRMIYQNKPRMQLDDTFGAFDCPDAGQIAPRRNVSTTPLQALNLLNSTFAVAVAEKFAGRLERDAGAKTEDQVARAFDLTLQRAATSGEFEGGVRLAKEHGMPALCRALLNANEFLYAD